MYIIRYPLFINLLISLMNFPIAWQMLSMPFLAPKSDFWCERPEEAKDIWCGYLNKFELVKIITFFGICRSEDEWRRISQPVGDDGKVDHCSVYNYTALLDGGQP